MIQTARYTDITSINVGEGWSVERTTSPSRRFGANDIPIEPNDRIYVVQVAESQVSVFDIETCYMETVSAKGGDIVAPDDAACDPTCELDVTEYYDDRATWTLSISGMNTAPFHIAHGTAQAGMAAATRTTAVELIWHNIRVHAIAPGATAPPPANTYLGHDP